ncbi:MAG: hypothetical protein JO113_00590, partial [Candidatus Eremiobacteraeota bacterium]|nr:hypothetical protein [Candidatus Eremiobacteraeota bacterium]
MLKFGGTSVATSEQRAIAYNRVRDARDAGFATVAVVSAMGRSPEAYATDTLLELIGGRSGNTNADLLLAAGELVSAAVFADGLCALGVDAVALVAGAGAANAGITVDILHLTRTGDTPDALRAIDPKLIGYAQICDGPLTRPKEEWDDEGFQQRQIPGDGGFP